MFVVEMVMEFFFHPHHPHRHLFQEVEDEIRIKEP